MIKLLTTKRRGNLTCNETTLKCLVDVEIHPQHCIFTRCDPLVLYICSGCNQRCPSHYPPTEALLPHLQKKKKNISNKI